MDEICRLCCTNKYVNNDIFDEENALFIKMSLYLPIKIFRNDRLPKKICDKCSCKVNDFYQFCNETIEVQQRLQTLIDKNLTVSESVDLTFIKPCTSPLPSKPLQNEQSTQTQSDQSVSVELTDIKEEKPLLPSIKEELVDMSDFFDASSSDSDDVSLLSLKQQQNIVDIKSEDVSKKKSNKVSKLNDWELLGNKLSSNQTNNKKCTMKTKPKPVNIVSIEKDQEIYNCCICFKKCHGRINMIHHYKCHGDDSQKSCEEFTPPAAPDVEPFQCYRCGKKLNRAEWEVHWQWHYKRDRRPYNCSVCDRAYRHPTNILKHGLTHAYDAAGRAAAAAAAAGARRFLCDLCPRASEHVRELLAHRTVAHPEALCRAVALRCGVCARSFAQVNSLRRHMRAHSGERNFLCNVCGKALSSREHLKFHIRIHTGFKPNVCNTCGKGFVKKCNLNLHERVHSGEKPHVCSHCGKAFSQRSTLVIHERYHSGARPYACELCGRGFVAKGLLTMHLKTTCI